MSIFWSFFFTPTTLTHPSPALTEPFPSTGPPYFPILLVYDPPNLIWLLLWVYTGIYCSMGKIPVAKELKKYGSHFPEVLNCPKFLSRGGALEPLLHLCWNIVGLPCAGESWVWCHHVMSICHYPPTALSIPSLFLYTTAWKDLESIFIVDEVEMRLLW